MLCEQRQHPAVTKGAPSQHAAAEHTQRLARAQGITHAVRAAAASLGDKRCPPPSMQQLNTHSGSQGHMACQGHKACQRHRHKACQGHKACQRAHGMPEAQAAATRLPSTSQESSTLPWLQAVGQQAGQGALQMEQSYKLLTPTDPAHLPTPPTFLRAHAQRTMHHTCPARNAPHMPSTQCTTHAQRTMCHTCPARNAPHMPSTQCTTHAQRAMRHACATHQLRPSTTAFTKMTQALKSSNTWELATRAHSARYLSHGEPCLCSRMSSMLLGVNCAKDFCGTDAGRWGVWGRWHAFLCVAGCGLRKGCLPRKCTGSATGMEAVGAPACWHSGMWAKVHTLRHFQLWMSSVDALV